MFRRAWATTSASRSARAGRCTGGVESIILTRDQSGMTHLAATILRLAFPRRVAQLTAGDGNCLILAASGAVYALGSNEYNQTAPLPNTDHDVQHPTLVTGLSGGIAAVHASTCSSFAVWRVGELLAWGGASDGELGSGSIGHRRTDPARVEALSGVRVGALGAESAASVTASSRPRATRLALSSTISGARRAPTSPTT